MGNSEFTIQINTLVVLVISVLFFIGMLVLIFAYFKLSRRVERVEKPRYGFLGKPLSYAFIGISLGMMSLFLITSGFDQVRDARTSANEKYSSDIQSFILSDSQDSVKLALSGVIYDEGEIWGVRNYEFEWRIEGEYKKPYPIIEVGRNRENPSYIVVDLPRDKYVVKLKATSGNIVITKTKVIDIR